MNGGAALGVEYFSASASKILHRRIFDLDTGDVRIASLLFIVIVIRAFQTDLPICDAAQKELPSPDEIPYHP